MWELMPPLASQFITSFKGIPTIQMNPNGRSMDVYGIVFATFMGFHGVMRSWMIELT
jgi:hypothetical protein